jgi:hypothetical protein
LVQNVTCDGGEPDQVGAGLGAQEEVGAFGHLVFAQIEDDELLPAQFVGLLNARGQNRMAFRRVAADDDDQARLLNVLDGAGIAAVTDRAKKADRGR